MIPDLNPETVSWETFGFPDPTFVPAPIGLYGLLWAYWEREILPYFHGEWHKIFASFLERVRPFDPGPLYNRMTDFDYELELLSRHYCHPDRVEDYMMGELTSDEAVWTIRELLAVAAGGNYNDVVFLRKFQPEFFTPWLLQRYNAVNLLRYAVPRHFCKTEVISGVSTWGERFTSLDAAIASAIANKETHTSTGWTDPMLQYTYRDPSWGANAGYGDVRFQHLNRVYVDLPSGVTNWTGFMGADFWIPDGCLAPPNYPGAGYSRIASDGNGDFLAAPFPFWTGMTLPTEQSVEYALGMYGEPRFYFDLYPQFHFKPEE